MNAHNEMVIEIQAPGFRLRRLDIARKQFQPSQAPAPPVNQKPTEARQFAGAVIGSLIGVSESGVPLVHFRGNPADSPLPAILASPVTVHDIDAT